MGVVAIGLLWAVDGGRVVEIHRDWALIELARRTDCSASSTGAKFLRATSPCPGSGRTGDRENIPEWVSIDVPPERIDERGLAWAGL